MSLPQFVAILAVAFGVLIKLVGFPDQFRINFKRKSTEGVSTILHVLAFISYVLWTMHGVFRKDWALIVGQGAGIPVTGIILAQIVLYRRRRS